jgi:hypothetical protein
MRIALSIAALAATVCFYVSSSKAQTIGDAPWCAVTNTGADRYEWDCEYDTVRDCTPYVIAGNRGFCQMNPYYRPAPAALPYRKHYGRRHHPYQ